MISRFELFVVLRNQLSDRRLVRRSLAVEAAMEELAEALGEDPAAWGLCGLGADLDAELCGANAARRGAVAEELLVCEGVPAELAAAARTCRRAPAPELTRLAAALAVASALVDEVHARLELGEGTLDDLEGRALAHRLVRAAERRGDEAAQRVLACAARAGLTLEDAAARALAGLRRVREDLRL